MKCLVTGYKGQLGYDIVEELKKRNIECIGTDINDFDLTKEEEVHNYIKNYHPDVIFHCAAYTQVDKAEENKELCHDVNVNGTKYITNVAKELDAKLIYISTDYVFNGEKIGYYNVDDEKDPINYYGLTKFLGEKEVKKHNKHFIVRISWVFGINGNNFIKTMLKLSETKDELSVVSDQIGSPTYTYDLSKLLVDMCLTDYYGTYHATNEDICSWYEFAKYIFEINNVDIKLNEILTKDYKTLAKRPYNSKMDKSKLDEHFYRLPSWKDATKRYCEQLKEMK